METFLQELLTAYFDTKRPRDERRSALSLVSNSDKIRSFSPCRSYLAQMYNFNCSCQVCSLPPGESRASDLRLQSMSMSYNNFKAWGTQQISGLEALDLVRKIWRTGEEEGYWSECVLHISYHYYCVNSLPL